MELLPLGTYEYIQNEYNLQEAWKKIQESYQNEEMVVCRVVDYDEKEKSLWLDFHGITGVLKRGYITQNRYLPDNAFLGKNIVVNILKIEENTRSFIGTRLLVEEQAKKQLNSMKRGDILEGIVSSFANDESCAFVDIKEGIKAFLSKKNVTRLPTTCCKLSEYVSIGQRIQGQVIFIEPQERPVHSTYCAISILKVGKEWTEEIEQLREGDVVFGCIRKDSLNNNRGFIEYSSQLCIQVKNCKEIENGEIVRVKIVEINIEKEKIYACLDEGNTEGYESGVTMSEHMDESQSEVSVENEDFEKRNEEKKRQFEIASILKRNIKATKSPFSMRSNEHKNLESIPNKPISMRVIEDKIRIGHLSEDHFNILKAINCMIYCTSLQIMSFFYSNQISTQIKNQIKLNNRLETMVKLSLIDRMNFQSDEGIGIYRVYCLNKNGDLLLQTLLGQKRTSYEQGMIAVEEWIIKRQLETNQMILAFNESYPFFKDFYIRKVIEVDEKVPVRPSAILEFENTVLLLETVRRYAGWEEKLHDKMDRYQILFERHAKNDLWGKTPSYLRMPLFLVVACEDYEQCSEVKNILYGHKMYMNIFFTYDLLIFEKGVDRCFFCFSIGQDIKYIDVKEVLQHNMTYMYDEVKKIEIRESEDIIKRFQDIVNKNFQVGLEFLIEHDCEELREFVETKMGCMYKSEDGKYQFSFQKEEQYWIYLFYLITHHLFSNPIAQFREGTAIVEKEMIAYTHEEQDEENVICKPSDLESAVYLVLKKMESWLCKYFEVEKKVDVFHIQKHPIIQSSGIQHGYDVGFDFTYQNEEYHIGFECKNYQKLRERQETKGKGRLSVSAYAYNLLEFYMSCQTYAYHNYWILVCPFGDLQNDFYKDLFQKWNKEINFMQIYVISENQTRITCEEFLSMDEEAYKLVYKHSPKKVSKEEENVFFKKLFRMIVGENYLKDRNIEELSKYPFEEDFNPYLELMPIKTIEGKDVLEEVFHRLDSKIDNQGVFIIGEYGSGKTYLTYQIIKMILDKPDIYAFYPLWIKLGDSYICDKKEEMELAAKQFVREAMEKNPKLPYGSIENSGKRILIILDGLDEIISGLNESKNKIDFLQYVIRECNGRFNYCDTKFIITSREKDFIACSHGSKFNNIFRNYSKIVIGDCSEEDAFKKLESVENAIKDTNFTRITKKPNLVHIARKPLYFGFIRELIRNGGVVEAENEIDILKMIIDKAVCCYQKYGVEDIRKRLQYYARCISEQLTEGKGDGFEIPRFMLNSDEEKNVIRLKSSGVDKYQLYFYHNAIREYLVAESLYEEINKIILDELEVAQSSIVDWMEKLDLTPETIYFLNSFLNKEPQKKEKCCKILEEILTLSCNSGKQKLGTHVLSLLFAIQKEICNYNLKNIHADNVFLWNCSLHNVDFQGAIMHDCTLFNVDMEHVNFTGADLTGLSIGTDEKIKDLYHEVRGSELSIWVLYTDGNLIKYHFPEAGQLQNYSIVQEIKHVDKQYYGICPIGEELLLYSEQSVKFTKGEGTYKFDETYKLIYLDRNVILFTEREEFFMVLHNQSYQTKRIIRLGEEEFQTICVLDWTNYLFIRDSHLYLQCEETNIFIIDMNVGFECYTACKKQDEIYIFLKYSNDIQKIIYNVNTKERNYDSEKVPEGYKYLKITAISENLLYGISEQEVFVHNFTETGSEIEHLQIKVTCHEVILENEDGTKKLQGEREYHMLNACEG